MATYAIGDVQGCYDSLMQLLKEIKFNDAHDTLWFTGDIVNRGPQSLEVLRFVKSLDKNQVTVLGNHDLHLIAVYYGAPQNQFDTFSDVLTAPDKSELIDWLCKQSLFYFDEQLKFALVHAGLSPDWSIHKALNLAEEVEAALQSAKRQEFLQHMYGNIPETWDDALTGLPRLRIITNYFTRVRYCYEDGRMNFNFKGEVRDKPGDMIPWYEIPNRQNADVKIIFGHWAALDGKTNCNNVFALDTGCVWGRCLTAMRLEDEKRFHVDCPPRMEPV